MMSVLGHDDVGDPYNWGRIIAIWSEKFEMRKLNAFVGRLCQQQKMLKKMFLTNSDKMSVIVEKISLKLQIQRWRKKRIFVLRKAKINMNAGS